MIKLKQAVVRAGGVLAAVAVAVSPMVAGAAQDTQNTTITANIGSTITLGVDGSVTLSLTPGSSAVTSTASDAVSVSTNNSTGYTLSLADADATTSLESGSDVITAHAAPATAPTALANNTWGYAVAGAPFDATYTAFENDTALTPAFAGVPATGSGDTIYTHNGTATGETTTVWYGARVDASQPTGSYTDTVTYTAVTN